MRSELSLPAGSLQCALRAFEGGADSVYLGMKNFSARKGAVNFSFEDLRKLKQVCLEKNRKFYIALNTLVDDSQLPEVENCLRRLEYLEPDGVIVQDMGIARLVRTRYPSLALHASTQLAVHTVSGVRELQEMGFVRVVLARELSFDEVAHIRHLCPDVQLKVFIHGAMCFGFSGLCMASEILTGRSANCGDCAQICRSWFSWGNREEKFWPFSMRDMELETDVLRYQDIGIDSFKVEGRMKGPEYVYHCARYYSMLLDGAAPEDPVVEAHRLAMETAFARQLTKGFTDTGTKGNRDGESLTCPDYPSHRGIEVGRIRKVMKNRAEVIFSRPVALHDGLLVVNGNESAGFALSGLENNRSFAGTSSILSIDFPSGRFSRKPQPGTPVMCVSRHNMNLGLLSENIPMYRKPLGLTVTLRNTEMEINGTVFTLQARKAESDNPFSDILKKVFTASGNSLFTCGRLVLHNFSGFENPFVPISVLKQIRRSFYQAQDAGFEHYCSSSEPSVPVKIPVVAGNEENIVSMNPVMFDEEGYFMEMDSLLEKNPETLFGLNNIAHLAWAERHPQAKVFADSFLYTRNAQAWKALEERVSLRGARQSIQNLPLFISRVCARHSSLAMPCKGCSRNNTYRFSQNGKTFEVRCVNCITTVTLKT